ncbi:putative F-box domain-containing protein [Medicago truncatula]|uniref:F-box protein interaction domain protein n=1 Tax=Medicago truncatula TaxID=3880 RepID=G7KEN9_MEDTR|nr:F-box/kelch-repeat protein At3g06240-like [Medicago truncatula]AET00914.1 F-box protein interaction domain protein [Medicago truncatula]RHN58114.1 putative F-box domain-containing protein [Medicago truncatula]
MEKSVIAADGKVNNHIHDDIAIIILSKLPLKSLTRFGCVRKSWSFLLDNPYFKTMFRRNFLYKNHSYYNDTSLFLRYNRSWFDTDVISGYPARHGGLFSLSGERFENRVELDWPNLFSDDRIHFKICGYTSVNGIICIDYNSQGRVVLWNLATKENKIIPSSPFASQPSLNYLHLHGFGYDHIRNNYKLIRHAIIYPTTCNMGKNTPYSLWEIYCLKSNSWRKLDVDMPSSSRHKVGGHVYMDGVCHWLSKTYNKNYLVSFNLTTEMFVTTSILTNTNDIDYRYLAMLNRSIALISNFANTTTFHISILGEVGVKESWTKLFTIKLHDIGWPIGVSKNGDIFFRKNDDELVCFNLSTQRIQQFGVKGGYYSQIITYKESLVSIERE